MGYYVTYLGHITIPLDKEREIYKAMIEATMLDSDDWSTNPWEFLREQGFDVEDTDQPLPTRHVNFNDKSGDEDAIFKAITEAGGSVYLEASGEDGGLWLNKGSHGSFVQLKGTIVYGEIGEDL